MAIDEQEKSRRRRIVYPSVSPFSSAQLDDRIPSTTKTSTPATKRVTTTAKQLLLMNVAEQTATKYLLALSMTQVIEVTHDVHVEQVPLTANDVEGLIC